jgi:hypothetical protein
MPFAASFPLQTTPASRAGAVALAVAALFAAGAAQAQSLTPAQFAAACQGNPGNTVVLTQPTKFQTSFQGSTTNVGTGCTVVLGSGATFELDTITMRFAGPFVVQGGAQSKVTMYQATLTAPRVTLALIGDENQFLMNSSRLAATSGALALQFGEKGFMEVANSGSWYQPRLSARGRLTLSAGAFFNGTVVQSGLQGATGVGFTFSGAESNMKIENTDVLLSSGLPNGGTYTNGALQVTSSASKVAFEMNQVNLMEAGQAINVALSGRESKLGMLRVSSQTGSQRIALTATGAASEVKVENVLMYGNPEVIIESGAQGSTSVTNSPGTISATQLIRVRAGLGGSCSASTQGLSAPVLQVCQ